MEDKDELKNAFEEEIEKIKSESVLSPEFRRRKTILWVIRTIIAILIYFLFLETEWLRWTFLIVYIPLSIMSLLSIYGWNIFLKRKIDKTRKAIEDIDT